jgi:hypothetical protein
VVVGWLLCTNVHRRNSSGCICRQKETNSTLPYPNPVEYILHRDRSMPITTVSCQLLAASSLVSPTQKPAAELSELRGSVSIPVHRWVLAGSCSFGISHGADPNPVKSHGASAALGGRVRRSTSSSACAPSRSSPFIMRGTFGPLHPSF